MKQKRKAGAVLRLLFAMLLALAPSAAWAAVRITFYSKEFGSSFPHAFVTMEGTLDRDGQRVDEDYGFSAKAITPAILLGRVSGSVITDHSKTYVAGSDKHFTLEISDAEYDNVMRVIDRWRNLPQPSYDLDRQNCVHFVGELAAALGMKAEPQKKLMKKPRSFVQWIAATNRDWLAARNAALEAAP